MTDFYDKALATRRQVLGDPHMDRVEAATEDFDRPLQILITEYAYGAVWGRDVVDRRMRSILNLGMLTALNRPEELRTHVRAAITNGLTPAEIGELLMQTAIYCGVPAALEATKVAKAVLKEMDLI